MMDLSVFFRSTLMILLQAVFTLLETAYLLRFLMQCVRADFSHPLAQTIVRITNPFLVPMRRWIPSLWGMDLASIIVLLALFAVETGAVTLLTTASLSLSLAILPRLPILCLLLLLRFCLYIMLGSIVLHSVMILLRGGRSDDPLGILLAQINQPVLSRIRRTIPAFYGIDWSPLIAIVAGQILLLLLNGAIANATVLMAG